MKTFTPTQLRDNSGEVFSKVQQLGIAKIESRSRPAMILCTQEKFDSLIKQAEERGES